MNRRKLSASGIQTFLSSPRAYYFRYIMGIEPISPAGASSPDALVGSLFAEYTDRFYKGMGEAENTKRLLTDWDEQTAGWVPTKLKMYLTAPLTAWAGLYYQLYSADDGCRNGSEKRVENDRFVGYVDGLSHDRILLELKTTSRARSLQDQIWAFQRSLQVRLYCVLTEATGIRIEMAYKDQPYALHRADVIPVTAEERKRWEVELNTLADTIVGLGDNPDSYPCHTKGCNIFSRNYTSACAYQALCEYGCTPEILTGYQERTTTRK